MKYYQVLTLLPEAEVPLNFLLSKVFMQIHIAIVNAKNKKDTVDYGISFPEYSEKELGSKIRIFAREKEELEALNVEDHLKRLCDYVHVTKIRKVPSTVNGYAFYSRYQPDESVERKAKRYVTRHEGITYEEAKELLKSRKDNFVLPYVKMKSASNENGFSLFIRRTKTAQKAYSGFCSYGLSAKSTVPEF